MRVAVIGGGGVLGSWVTAEVAAAGRPVVVFDRREDRSVLDVAAPEVEIEIVDVQSERDVAEKLREHDVSHVVNAAALMPDACEEDPVAAVHVNLVGAINVTRAAASCGVGRTIFFSSRAVLGALGGEHLGPEFRPVSEDLPLNPENVYGSVKASAERICARIAHRMAMEFATFRLASTYGPGKSVRHGDLAIISRIVEGVVAGEPIAIERGADQLNDFLYCRDIGRAAALAIVQERPVEGLFHITSGSLSTLAQVARAVREIVPDARIDIGPGLDYRGAGPTPYVRMSGERAREAFGYSPRYDIRSGVQDYLRLAMSRQGAE